MLRALLAAYAFISAKCAAAIAAVRARWEKPPARSMAPIVRGRFTPWVGRNQRERRRDRRRGGR